MLETPQKQAEDFRKARPAYELATALLIALVLAVWSLALGHYFPAVNLPVNSFPHAVRPYDNGAENPEREEQAEKSRRQQDKEQHYFQNPGHLAEVYTVRPEASMVLTGSKAEFCYTSCRGVALAVYDTCLARGGDPQTECFQLMRTAWHDCYHGCEKGQ